MNSQSYFITQEQLGTELRNIIDTYFKRELGDPEMKLKIKEVIGNNRNLFYSGSLIAERIKRKLGKKRLSLILRVLEAEFNKEENVL